MVGAVDADQHTLQHFDFDSFVCDVDQPNDHEALDASAKSSARGQRRRAVATPSQTSAMSNSRKRKLNEETSDVLQSAASSGSTRTVAGKQYRQAQESATGDVEVLCFTCRRSKDNSVQKSVTSYFKSRAPLSGCIDLTASDESSTAVLVTALDAAGSSVCARCRKIMHEKGGPVLMPSERNTLKGTGELPQLQRFRAYKRVAEKQSVPFTIPEHRASALMRSDCIACGAKPPVSGHGLTRLRRWPVDMQRPDKGGFMGPYAEENLAAACAMCNLMKGHRRVRGYIECVRHIATNHTPGEDFGYHPQRFRDNVTKRARSGYISNSSRSFKTHAISNEEFNQIVSSKCFYCHKEPRTPKTLGPDDRGHFNGLDRLDSSNRLYTTETVVACCGTCNIMKYRWPLDGFLEHCRKVARFNIGRVFQDEDADDSEVAEDDLEASDVNADLEQSDVVAAEAVQGIETQSSHSTLTIAKDGLSQSNAN